MLEKGSPSLEVIKGSKKVKIQEEICEPLNANLKENVEDPDLADVGMLNIENLDLNDEDMLGIIHPLLTIFNQDVQVNEDCYHRGKVFQTWVNCKKQICSLVIDTRSCINAISKDAVQKLGLKVEPLLNLYYVAWVTNTKLKVDKSCLVTFEIGKLKENVMCDVLPLKPCHIISSRPWICDRDAHHVGCSNTYSFAEGNKKYTLTCARDMPNLKLKKSSFLIWKIVPSNGILGPTPNSTNLSYFQRGRHDGKIVTWLKKGYSLRKPKAKAKPRISVHGS